MGLFGGTIFGSDPRVQAIVAEAQQAQMTTQTQQAALAQARAESAAKAQRLGIIDQYTGIDYGKQQSLAGPQPTQQPAGMPGHGTMAPPLMGTPQPPPGGLMGAPPGPATQPPLSAAQRSYNQAYPDQASMIDRMSAPEVQSMYGGGGNAAAGGADPATIRQLMMLDPTGKQAAEYIKTVATPAEKAKFLNYATALPDGDPRKTIATQINQHDAGIETDPNKIAETKASTVEKQTAAEKNKVMTDSMAGAQLDEPTLGFMAKQYISGDHSVASGLGFGNIGSTNRAKFMKIMTDTAMNSVNPQTGKNFTPEDITGMKAQFNGEQAAQRAIGSYGGRMEVVGNEIDKLAPQALTASENVPRGDWVPVNQAVQLFQAGKSSPELSRFAMANMSMANTFSMLAGRGTPTVANTQHAYDVLSTAKGPEGYAAAIDQLKQEALAARQSAPAASAERSKAFTANVTSPPAGAAAPAAGPVSPAAGVTLPPDVQTLVDKYRTK